MGLEPTRFIQAKDFPATLCYHSQTNRPCNSCALKWTTFSCYIHSDFQPFCLLWSGTCYNHSYAPESVTFRLLLYVLYTFINCKFPHGPNPYGEYLQSTLARRCPCTLLVSADILLNLHPGSLNGYSPN